MGGILITKSDNIPTKKIVEVLGNVSAKKIVYASERPDQCFEKLKKQAEKMGADAIVNVTYNQAGTWGWFGTCNGIAVKLEDASMVGSTAEEGTLQTD